jgi:hypothetical protein
VLAPGQVRQFDEQGFVLVPGLLDPKAELAALDLAFQDLIETLCCIHFAEAGRQPPPDLRDRPLGERVALMQGASGGQAIAHLDPSLTAGTDADRRRSDLPSAQLPELFQLMRAAALLDALEALVGHEIDASPSYHLHFKLSQRQLALARETAGAFGLPDPTRLPYHDFHLGQTIWHRDALYSLPDAWQSRIVVAWIPLTPAGGERGSLVAVPGSHRDRKLGPDREAELRARSVEIEAGPGDVVFFDNWLLHASSPNRSESDMRWVFNFRYLPRGQSAGRPHLPSVPLRSRAEPRRELRNGLLWSELWRRALDHASRAGAPAVGAKEIERARAINREWSRRIPDELAWLTLAPADPGSERGAAQRLSRGLRRWLASRRGSARQRP